MKKLIILFIIICLSPVVTSAQFSKKELKTIKKVLKRSSAAIRQFKSQSLISVERLNNPDLEGLIENALFMAGFEVVSNDVAKSYKSISNPLNRENKNIEISAATKYKAVYVITVGGKEIAVIGKCPKGLSSFTARIVDLSQDGKLVGTFRYEGSTLSVQCPSDVANALAYKLMELSN